MTTPPSQDEFVAVVREAFAFLAKTYGFAEQPARAGAEGNAFAVTFKNDTTSVVVEGISWGTATMVWVGPRNATQNADFERVPLWAMARTASPSDEASLSVVGQIEQVKANAELLEKLALPALRGDFSCLEAPRRFLLDRVRNPDAYR